MFNPFVWLDSILLGTAQKFCDKMQRLTGLTKFTFQKWALIMAAVFFWGVCLTRQYLVLNIVVSIWTLFVVGHVWSLEKEEAEFLKNDSLTSSLYSSFEGRFFPSTLYVLFAVLDFFSDGHGPKMWFYVMISFVSYIYFSACVPRPPSKSKMRELYEKGLWWLNDQLKPEPALVPIHVPSR